VLADFRRADQHLERSAEPAALAGHNQIMDAALRRGHVGRGNLAITAHFVCSNALFDWMIAKPFGPATPAA